MTNLEINSRIQALRNVQAEEVRNNFLNGDLWNDCEDIIWRLENYGQEKEPTVIYNDEGYDIGYRLEDGTEVYEEGMSIYDSCQY